MITRLCNSHRIQNKLHNIMSRKRKDKRVKRTRKSTSQSNGQCSYNHYRTTPLPSRNDEHYQASNYSTVIVAHQHKHHYYTSRAYSLSFLNYYLSLFSVPTIEATLCKSLDPRHDCEWMASSIIQSISNPQIYLCPDDTLVSRIRDPKLQDTILLTKL